MILADFGKNRCRPPRPEYFINPWQFMKSVAFWVKNPPKSTDFGIISGFQRAVSFISPCFREFPENEAAFDRPYWKVSSPLQNRGPPP